MSKVPTQPLEWPKARASCHMRRAHQCHSVAVSNKPARSVTGLARLMRVNRPGLPRIKPQQLMTEPRLRASRPRRASRATQSTKCRQKSTILRRPSHRPTTRKSCSSSCPSTSRSRPPSSATRTWTSSSRPSSGSPKATASRVAPTRLGTGRTRMRQTTWPWTTTCRA